MKFIIFFAVTRYNERIYMTEQEDETCSRLVDLINDCIDLQNELDWSELDEAHQPNAVGCYQAVVKCIQTEEDDYSLIVTSCTPVYLI